MRKPVKVKCEICGKYFLAHGFASHMKRTHTESEIVEKELEK